MKNKGFTLIELLGVIILLTLLIIIVYPNIIDSVKNSSEKTDELTLRMIYDAADLYVSDNKKKFTGTYNGKYIIDLKDLVDADILSSPIKLSNSDDITNDKCVQVTYSYEDGYKYELRDNGECEGPSYSITYNLKNVEIDNSLETIQEKERYIATLTLKTGYKDYILDVKVIMGNEDITQTVYDNGEINIENVTGNIEITAVAAESYFAIDTWDEINENICNGNTSIYEVGDQKELTIDGFGTYKVRISNMSTPTTCTYDSLLYLDNSRTACGFVIEFVDIITTYMMKSSQTATARWDTSAMKTYLNSTIYNALPQELKDNIINTSVAFNVNPDLGDTNDPGFLSVARSTDKLYLLSPKEIYGTNEVINDDSNKYTGQLDYYQSNSVTTSSNVSKTIKYYNGSTNAYWLRSAAYMLSNYSFWSVQTDGTINTNSFPYSNAYKGVSPAFRIGNCTN